MSNSGPIDHDQRCSGDRHAKKAHCGWLTDTPGPLDCVAARAGVRNRARVSAPGQRLPRTFHPLEVGMSTRHQADRIHWVFGFSNLHVRSGTCIAGFQRFVLSVWFIGRKSASFQLLSSSADPSTPVCKVLCIPPVHFDCMFVTWRPAFTSSGVEAFQR